MWGGSLIPVAVIGSCIISQKASGLSYQPCGLRVLLKPSLHEGVDGLLCVLECQGGPLLPKRGVCPLQTSVRVTERGGFFGWSFGRHVESS